MIITLFCYSDIIVNTNDLDSFPCIFLKISHIHVHIDCNQFSWWISETFKLNECPLKFILYDRYKYVCREFTKNKNKNAFQLMHTF